MFDSLQRGSISETAVTLDLLRQGFNVLMPVTVSRYDLLVDVGARFLRVQVKTAWTDRRDGNIRVTWDRPYEPDEVDLIAIYDPTSFDVYYVPIGDIPVGAKGVTIRLTQYKYSMKNSNALLAEKYRKFPLERMVS